MLEFFIFLVGLFVVPVLLDQSSKRKHFEWVGPWLKEAYAVLFIVLICYFLWGPGLGLGMTLRSYAQGSRIWGAIFTLAGTGLFFGYWMFLGRVITPVEKAKIIASANSNMIERLYFRGFQPRTDVEYRHKPTFREFFYEWELTLESNQDIVNKITVTVNNVTIDERPNLPVFTNKRIEPRWKSGFPEPGRAPDFYVGVFEISYLPKNVPTKIIIRRPVRFNDKLEANFPLNYATRDFDILARECEVEKHNYDFSQQGDRVMLQFKKLADYGVNGVGNPNPPIRPNPDTPTAPLEKNEIEGSVILRFPNDTSEKPTAEHIEGRWGQREEWNFPVQKDSKK